MSDTPKIVEMQVIPVAGYDSMLLNIAGAHHCYFTRILLVLKDNAGHTGVGEAPATGVVLKILNDAVPHIVGQEIGIMNQLVSDLHKRDLDENRQPKPVLPGFRPWDLERHHNAVAVLETALLDLMGQFLNQPVAQLLGPGKQRDEVPVLGYLFYIADRQKTDLDYLPGNAQAGQHPWYHLRHQEAMSHDKVVQLAEAAQDKYGFKDFKLKGGVQAGEVEIETVRALKKRFPQARITVDPNASWSLEQAISLCKDMHGILSYVEDPCGAEQGFSGRETLAEFKRATGLPVATNMIANDWRQMSHALQLNAIDIPLADPHYWSMRGANTIGTLCNAWGMTLGCHSNNHFDVSLAMLAHLGAAAPGEITPFDTHWIWQEGQHLTKNPLQIKEGKLALNGLPGLGVELDMDAVGIAHQRYNNLRQKDRDDAVAMQYLIRGWAFDGKRATLVR
ncbi:glucarate dehydratase-related protein [Rahnella sp. BIGb0236]|uniref:enolase C-terminal domain-like protein n=1 Tax=Rahnella sp. BIGb0236 TaxID=2485117 RepID=UPI001061049F|nr:enolase C-terminal domain-like protein [Rahnella sp. BIGb0236]TDS95667.1 glucarate dehydratase-related protein [Rahnella sp. BIGb0236]